MNLTAAGLNETDTIVYQTLLSKKEWKPSDLAKNVGESRTNIYKILDKLVQLQLATRIDSKKVLYYRAENPIRLIYLSREKRNQREQDERDLELNHQNLLQDYIQTNEQPGVQYYQGQTEISNIFKEIAQSKTDVHFIHTTKGQDFYGYDTMNKLRLLAPVAKVKRYALTPDSPKSQVDYKITDPLVLLERTWLEGTDYTSPVEWGVYDNKLYIISYGQEAIGLTIESKQISEAFVQIYKIIEKNQKNKKDYNMLPKRAKQLSQPFAIN